MEKTDPPTATRSSDDFQEGVTEFVWAGLKGGLAFAVLGTIGSIRRGQIPLLPALAHTIFGFHRAAEQHSLKTLANPLGWLKLPLIIGFFGFWGGGYVGYSQWKLEKDMKRYWEEREGSTPKVNQ